MIKFQTISMDKMALRNTSTWWQSILRLSNAHWINLSLLTELNASNAPSKNQFSTYHHSSVKTVREECKNLQITSALLYSNHQHQQLDLRLPSMLNKFEILLKFSSIFITKGIMKPQHFLLHSWGPTATLSLFFLVPLYAVSRVFVCARSSPKHELRSL